MRHSHALIWFVGLAALSLAAVSCVGVSEEKLPESGATLEGTIKYQGQTVEFAMILVNTPSGSATGTVGENGKYTVANVPLGSVKIGVNTSAARGEFQSKVMSQNAAAADPSKSTAVRQPKFVDVPEKYFDPETSGLTTTIQKGTNTFDITIP
jgi:hypothetical protein